MNILVSIILWNLLISNYKLKNNFQAMVKIVLNKLMNVTWDSEDFGEKTGSC